MRSFKTALPAEFLKTYQRGVLHHTYKGVMCLKSPIDLAICARAIWDLQPRTVIEIGSQAGGSALWLADLLWSFGLTVRLVSIDLAPPALTDPRIEFLSGDVNDIEPALADHGLLDEPHPWFVTEDSAHTYQACRTALEVLSRHMTAGDLLVMEDGVLDELGLSGRYDGGPNRAIAEFMEACPGIFEVDTELCDMFGPNVTYAPNGYLRKT